MEKKMKYLLSLVLAFATAACMVEPPPIPVDPVITQCWDTDLDTLCDLNTEDVNGDEQCSINDCITISPLYCWDTNGDGTCDPSTEDIDNDNACTVNDCRGAPTHCWDVNDNGSCDTTTEDTNGDGACTADDCRGDSSWIEDSGTITYGGTVVADATDIPWDGIGADTNHSFCERDCDGSGIGYSCTRKAAANRCRDMGMRLCTLAELGAYAEADYESCCVGWVADPGSDNSRTNGRTAYFMGSSTSSGYPGSCGGDPGGLRIYDNIDHEETWAAHCCR